MGGNGSVRAGNRNPGIVLVIGVRAVGATFWAVVDAAFGQLLYMSMRNGAGLLV